MTRAAQGDDRARAREIVLRRLAASPRSRSELARSLAERGIPDAVATEVLDRYAELHLVDDAAYAEVVVRSKQATRGLARRGLAHELRRRGVGDAEASAALEAVDPELERRTARALVERRLPGVARLERSVALRRLVGMLARKGYDGSLAVAVVREALDGAHPSRSLGAPDAEGGGADRDVDPDVDPDPDAATSP